jgi:uncharacterized Zn finger protein
MSWDEFEEGGYVSVAERQRRMLAQLDQLIAEGEVLEPIKQFKTRSIAKSFWGKAWCRHLEKFSDYESRLPIGRSSLKNGAVFHLAISEGEVRAKVCGSELFDLSIHIEPLAEHKWDSLKSQCQGKVGSLIELLQGKIPDEIMTLVTDRDHGLFPQPSEIRFNCNCPDWADLCEHSAAVMYGIGVRLDEQPELLFNLRGVNHEALIAVENAVDELTSGKPSRRRRTLDSNTLTDVFGIDFEQ